MKPTSIRLDEEVYKMVESEAKKESRSISKQIEHIIKKYFEIIRLTNK